MVHSTLSILHQQVHALALGHEDLNDHDALRRDTALQVSDQDGAHRAGAVLALLVKALRAEWPGVEVVLRADVGFCRPRILRWCESRGVSYVLGLLANSRGTALAELAGRDKVRLFDKFGYAARCWPCERKRSN